MKQEVVREEHNYLEIPYSLVYQEKSVDKPVVIFFHGFTNNRFLAPMGRDIELAKMGYTVLMLDAYNHGERITEEFANLTREEKHMQLVDIAIHTAKDAIKVYEYLCSEGILSKEYKLGAYGVSMGGATAYYLATIYPKLEVLVTLVASPSFTNYHEYRRKMYNFEKNEEYMKKYNYYKTIDPLLHYERFMDKKVFIAVGLKDQVVPMHDGLELSKKFIFVYKEYYT